MENLQNEILFLSTGDKYVCIDEYPTKCNLGRCGRLGYCKVAVLV